MCNCTKCLMLSQRGIPHFQSMQNVLIFQIQVVLCKIRIRITIPCQGLEKNHHLVNSCPCLLLDKKVYLYTWMPTNVAAHHCSKTVCKFSLWEKGSSRSAAWLISHACPHPQWMCLGQKLVTVWHHPAQRPKRQSHWQWVKGRIWMQHLNHRMVEQRQAN